MQTLLVKGTYSKYFCKVVYHVIGSSPIFPTKKNSKKISFLNFFCYIYNVRRYTEENINLRRLKIQTANFFQFVPFIQIKKKRILFLQTQKRNIKVHIANIKWFYFVRFKKKKNLVKFLEKSFHK